ncbi:MAG: SUMO-targeted ubiquitin ligase complex subunit slx8 [Pycnora praestabilis]|nr:MAG: SUMO-targeted ubiquitin ligase complex subunit slx8 [Pycnora praestabilis]
MSSNHSLQPADSSPQGHSPAWGAQGSSSSNEPGSWTASTLFHPHSINAEGPEASTTREHADDVLASSPNSHIARASHSQRDGSLSLSPSPLSPNASPRQTFLDAFSPTDSFHLDSPTPPPLAFTEPRLSLEQQEYAGDLYLNFQGDSEITEERPIRDQSDHPLFALSSTTNSDFQRREISARTPSHIRNSGFVDLTTESSPTTMPPRGSRKRSASQQESDIPFAQKRRRLSTLAASNTSRTKQEENLIEEVDLRGIEDDNGLSALLQKQRADQVKAQLKEGAEPPRLSKLQCIICLETPTDLTSTHCGHMFCHTCLMEALIAGESQARNGGESNPEKYSKCPVCRTRVNRNLTHNQVIPLELKLMTRGSLNKGKQRA